MSLPIPREKDGSQAMQVRCMKCLHRRNILEDTIPGNCQVQYMETWASGVTLPESGGINKLPRNFLTDGRTLHQFLKSAKDILLSVLSTSFDNVAALRNTSIVSWCELEHCRVPSWENIVSYKELKTAFRSDLKIIPTTSHHLAYKRGFKPIRRLEPSRDNNHIDITSW